MNDFTKEELKETLYCISHYQSCQWSKHELMKIEKKLQSLIDNYCEHSYGGEAEVFVDICSKCDALMSRNKTLREYNE